MISKTTPLMMLMALLLGACGRGDDAMLSSHQIPVAATSMVRVDLPGCDAVRFTEVRHDLWRHPDASDLLVVAACGQGVCIDSYAGLKQRLALAAANISGTEIRFCIGGDTLCGEGPNPIGDDPIPPSRPGGIYRPLDPVGDDPIPPSMPGNFRPGFDPFAPIAPMAPFAPFAPPRPGGGTYQPYDPIGDDPIPPSRPPSVARAAGEYRQPSRLETLARIDGVRTLGAVSR